MKNYLVFAIIFTGLAVAGCAPRVGTPIEISKACSPENEKKYVEITGFLDDKGGIFCSNRGGRMEYSLRLTETPGAEKKISAYVERGTGANTIEEVKSGYKREDIKIRDNAGNLVNLGDKLKLTGEFNTTGDPNICFLNVAKIEKQ